MKILLFLANGFETMEFSPFVDVMGWARVDYGADIQVETCGFTKEVRSTFGVKVLVDHLIQEIQVDDYAALAIPGGFEEFDYEQEAYDERFLELIREFDGKGILIASICVASLAIAKSGVLLSRFGTTYHLDGGKKQKLLSDMGVKVINEPIVTDRNIITSYCPETAPWVAFRLLELLTNEELARKVRIAMGFEVDVEC